MGTHRRFDRVGNEVARLQRKAHAVRAHRNTVTDTDGIKTHANQPGSFDTLFDPGCQLIQVHIARVAFVPHAGDANLCFLHVVFSQTRAIEHSLRSALRLLLCNASTVCIQLSHFHPLIVVRDLPPENANRRCLSDSAYSNTSHYFLEPHT